MVQLATIIKADNQIASVQLINAALSIRDTHQRVPKKAADTTRADDPAHPATCTVSMPAEITTEPTRLSP